MEVPPIDDTFEPFTPEVVEPKPWEHLAQMALNSFYGAAACAFIPAALRKKRSITFAPVGQFAPPVEVAAGGEEPVPPATKEEQEKVGDLFKIIAENSVLGLAPHAPNLFKIKRKILPMHPFAFLMSAPRKYVRIIFTGNSNYKITQVLGGIHEGMVRERAEGNLGKYIPAFAAHMGKDPNQIRRLIRGREVNDWLGLVNYLFDTAAVLEE